MLHYDPYLAQGFSIATGVIEGACRHLVKDRMDITGARWRCLISSSRLVGTSPRDSIRRNALMEQLSHKCQHTLAIKSYL
jgi:hypothetical protein